MSEETAVYRTDRGWAPGETFRERVSATGAAIGREGCEQRLADAGLEPTLYWRGLGVTGPAPTDEEARGMAAALGFPYPALDGYADVKWLLRRWLNRHGHGDLVLIGSGPDADCPWVGMVEAGRADVLMAVHLPSPRRHRGTAGVEVTGYSIVGWRHELTAHLVSVVPWVRDLHREDGGA